jgi:hypothetical protein
MQNYFAFLLLFLTVNLLAQEKPTRIYLVRHAEKITIERPRSLANSRTKRATALFKKLKQNH